MKNKILATIQDVNDDIQEYLNYAAFLSKSFDLELNLVAGSPEIFADATPTAIVGSGLQHPSKLVEHKVLSHRAEKLQDMVDSLMPIYRNVKYDLNLGTIESRIEDEQLNNEALFWTVNQKSSDTIFNELFGTTETEISKKTSRPALVVPSDPHLVKPKNVLAILNDYPKEELNAMQEFASRLNISLSFAFHVEKDEVNIDDLKRNVANDVAEFAGIVKSFNLDDGGDNFDRIMQIEKPDWLAFVNYDRSFIERMYKLNTNKVILSTELPVLIF